MTERKPHSDDELLEELTDGGPTPGQQSRSGGNLARDIGTRAELDSALQGDIVERVEGSDEPAQDESKGAKTADKIRSGNQDR